MTTAGVQVVLITDACRSNELPGKSDGARWTFNKVMEKQSGELQMTSCAGNEQSLEDKIWGGGRGVFSYYLINGLQGLADNDPEDGEVSFYELQKYVKDNLRRETKSLTTGKPRQNPMFCCAEMENEIVSKVDAEAKQELLANIRHTESNLLAVATLKGKLSNDVAVETLYDGFKMAIDSSWLIEPDSISAYHYYQLLEAKQLNEDLQADLKDALVAALINHAQSWINFYYSNEFNRKPLPRGEVHSRNTICYKIMSLALSVLGDSIVTNDLRAREYFLKAGDNISQFRKSGLENSIYMLDTAIALAPNAAYLYYYQAKLFNWKRDLEKEFILLEKAVQLAPKWTLPILDLASRCLDKQNFVQVEKYCNQALLVDSTEDRVYAILGWSYWYQNDTVRAIQNLLKAVELDPKDPRSIEGLGYIYRTKGDYSNSYKFFDKAITLDPRYPGGYFGKSYALSLQGYKDEAIEYLEKALALGLSEGYDPVSDAELNSLRTEPEFKALMRKYFPEHYKE